MLYAVRLYIKLANEASGPRALQGPEKRRPQPLLGLWPLFRFQTSLDLLHGYQFDASILGAALRRIVGRDEVGLPVAVGNHPAFGYTSVHQVIDDGLRTTIGQFEVVLLAADCVAVSVDVDDHVRVGLKNPRYF